MSHPDPLLMSADIARVAAERPELDEQLLGAIYQHLVLIEGRQPTIVELREYVDRVPVSTRTRCASGSASLLAGRAAAGPERLSRRPEGRRLPRCRRRPAATRGTGTARLDVRVVRDPVPRRPRAGDAAVHRQVDRGAPRDARRRVGTEPDYLRKLVKRYGLPASGPDEMRTYSGNGGGPTAPNKRPDKSPVSPTCFVRRVVRDAAQRHVSSIYISLPADAADRLRELAWRERRSPRQQAAVLVLAALEREGAATARGRRDPANGTATRPPAGAERDDPPRVTWTADRDGQAHAAITRRLRTPCGRRPIDPASAGPRRGRAAPVCLAGVEEVLPAKRR